MQDAVAGFETGVTASQQVHGAGHRTKVNAFTGRAALRVLEIRIEGVQQVFPGTQPVCARQYPCVDDVAQRRTVRGSGSIMLHGREQLSGPEAVAEPGEQIAEFLGRQQVQQHEDVGLLSAARMRSSRPTLP